MHHAPETPEILDAIFHHYRSTNYELDPGISDPIWSGEEVKRRADLLNFALTTCTWTSPALSVLWWRLENVIPLFNLVPAFSLSKGVLSHPTLTVRSLRLALKTFGMQRVQGRSPSFVIPEAGRLSTAFLTGIAAATFPSDFEDRHRHRPRAMLVLLP
ncbi:hypothetical protein FA15DRAFT_709369 [Coprinopsis marcescibilis]|uniref:Uncharacterized protein n=1 Tax=Coprinopsis marcescibilis TaxID=230819 RepID=A0A5C3KFU8_COPMA|nr:hypothetical protein FA15DRAFT_709369 [Coprinopsis marcescibilis]